MPGSARLKPRWPSQRWLPHCCCVARASRRCRCRCDVSMPRARLHGWRPAVTARLPVQPRAWPHRAHRWTCIGTAVMSSPGFAVDRRCCPEWSSSAKLFRRLSRDETGSATVVAAALVAALVAVALGGVLVGGAAVARHRAQAAADLAALAAAGRLPLDRRRPVIRHEASPPRWVRRSRDAISRISTSWWLSRFSRVAGSRAKPGLLLVPAPPDGPNASRVQRRLAGALPPGHRKFRRRVPRG